MSKLKAMIEYTKCYLEKCDNGKGVCVAVEECSFGVLKQDVPWEEPYILQNFCVGCGRCSTVCPFKAIKMR